MTANLWSGQPPEGRGLLWKKSSGSCLNIPIATATLLLPAAWWSGEYLFLLFGVDDRPRFQKGSDDVKVPFLGSPHEHDARVVGVVGGDVCACLDQGDHQGRVALFRSHNEILFVAGRRRGLAERRRLGG